MARRAVQHRRGRGLLDGSTHCSLLKKLNLRLKRHYGKFLIAALAPIAGALLAQNPAPTPHYSDQADLSKVEEWVLSQGIAQSIAPELAAILGLGSDGHYPGIRHRCGEIERLHGGDLSHLIVHGARHVRDERSPPATASSRGAIMARSKRWPAFSSSSQAAIERAALSADEERPVGSSLAATSAPPDGVHATERASQAPPLQ